MKKRIYEYDNLKAILIYLVVLGHLLVSFTHNTSDIAKLTSSFIYSFHMPLFFIISGYFSRKRIDKENIIKLIILFLFMNISFSIYNYLTFGKMQLFTFLYSSWYILLLLIYRLIIDNKKIKSIISNKPFQLFIISIIISVIAPIVNTNLFILRIFENWTYFLFGYLLIEKEDLLNLKIEKKYIYFGLLFFLIINSYISYNYYSNLGFFLGNSYLSKHDIIPKLILVISNMIIFIFSKNIISKKELPLITSIGKNSLYIYIFHRIPTLLISEFIVPDRKIMIIIDIVIAILLCLILSSKYIVEKTQIIINYLTKSIRNKNKITITILVSLGILLITFDLYSKGKIKIDIPKNNNEITISYVGDLILLEDQVNLSKTKLGYNFDYMFDYTKKYIKRADYTIGVFEGPSDDGQEYSLGNYIDNDTRELRINHPGVFINSIKKSGIDLVTLSNNHIYDRGYNGAINTINNLKSRGLDFVGANKENPQRKIVNIQGKKVGILAYTFYTNYPKDTDDKDLVKYLTNINSENYEEKVNEVKKDFDYLKEKDVDLIIVLPHYGTEFNFDFSAYQEEWNKTFSSFGADLILGDHSHVIGPIKYYDKTLAISSPGNYVNSYNGQDSDISNFITITINKKDNSIKNVKVIPLLAMKKDKGYYPISLYDLSKEDKNNERLKEALSIFGNVMMDNSNIELKEEYIIDPTEKERLPLELTDKDKETDTYKLIEESNKVCFIGDSITEGTMNEYHAWYEPLMDNFDKEIINISKGSYTTYDVIKDFSENIENSDCDLSIINIGTNDIRYNKTDSNDYIDNIKKIISYTNENSKVLLLSPWETYSNDKIIGDYILYKKDLYGKYNEKLIDLSEKNDNIYYMNPIRYIKSNIMKDGEEYYLLDGVHPNNNEGIKLYSYGVLRGNKY